MKLNRLRVSISNVWNLVEINLWLTLPAHQPPRHYAEIHGVVERKLLAVLSWELFNETFTHKR